MQNNSIKEILEQIANAQSIQIAGHTNPDGDAIGACLAFGMALENAGKDVTVLLEDFGKKYDIIPGHHLIKGADKPADLFLALDTGEELRLGAAGELPQKAGVCINIDHHRSNTYFGAYNYVDADASSASELVYRFLDGSYPLNREIASALYTGILYDTGAFRHSSTSPETMRIAGKLMEYDIPFTAIYDRFFDQRSFSELKIMGQALQNAERYFDGRVILTTITAEEIAACHGTNKELDAIVNYIRGVEGTQIACFLYEKNDTDVKASFRCGDLHDVCALSQKFGGGGHVKAAGCTITADIQKAKALVLAEIEKLM